MHTGRPARPELPGRRGADARGDPSLGIASRGMLLDPSRRYLAGPWAAYLIPTFATVHSGRVECLLMPAKDTVSSLRRTGGALDVICSALIHYQLVFREWVEETESIVGWVFDEDTGSQMRQGGSIIREPAEFSEPGYAR
jgi:hypothetical protein